MGITTNRAGESLAVWGEGTGYETKGGLWFARETSR
jgi:hypothetical protein